MTTDDSGRDAESVADEADVFGAAGGTDLNLSPALELTGTGTGNGTWLRVWELYRNGAELATVPAAGALPLPLCVPTTPVVAVADLANS